MAKDKTVFFILVLFFSLSWFQVGNASEDYNVANRDCSLPDVDNCNYESIYNDVNINDDSLKITNSKIRLHNVYLNTDSTWNLTNSTLEFNSIENQADYQLILNLEDSSLTLTAQSSLTIEELNFIVTDTVDSYATDSDSNLFKITGTNSTNITINHISTAEGTTSNLWIDNPASTITIFDGNFTNLYLPNGNVVLASPEASEDNEDINITIENIYGFDPDCKDSCTFENSGSLIIDGDDDNFKVSVENISLEQVFVQSGTLTISESMDITVLGGDQLEQEGTVVLDGLKSADVNEIHLTNLELIDTDLTLSAGGEIANITADDSSIIIFEHTDSSDYYHNDHLIFTETVEIVNLEIKAGSEVEVSATGNIDNINVVEVSATGNIDNINYDSTTKEGENSGRENSGTLYLHNKADLISDYVYLYLLIIIDSSYTINNTLDTNILYMNNSTLALSTFQDLSLETLYFSNDSEIIWLNDLELISDSTKHSKLYIDNSLLTLNGDLTASGTDMVIYVDNNEVGQAPLDADKVSGIYAEGEINLTCDDNGYCGSLSIGLHDTSAFNLEEEHTYIVMHADEGIYIPTNPDGSVNLDSKPKLNTELPEWFSICLVDSEGNCVSVEEVNGDNDVYVSIKREESYEDLVKPSGANDAWTTEIAITLDEMIAEQNYTEEVGNLISQLDLLSGRNTIANNIASLAPIEPSVFISNTHHIASSLLSLLNVDVASNSNLQAYNSNQQGMLWLRNGYSSVNSSFTYADSNQFDYYLFQSGVNLFSLQNDYSKFAISLSAGINLGQTSATSEVYNMDSVGYDVALNMYYYFYNYYINLSSMAIKLDNSNTRVDFADNTMTSNVASSAIFNSFSIGKISEFKNISMQNAFFINYGLVSVNDYQEKGTGALSLEQVSTTINEHGTSVVIYPSAQLVEKINNNLLNHWQPHFSAELYYKDYYSPQLNAQFVDITPKMNLIGDDYSSVVFNYSLAIDYIQADYSLSFKVGKEVAISNYNKNYFLINYLLPL